jgi:hypothetical protein
MAERKPEHSISTFTGRRFWPLDARPGEVSILDIAHALSNQGRFTGHTTEFYSVAQHSVLVSEVVAPQYALWGLLHDATEAYLIDLASPVKMQIPEYKVIEARLMEVIAAAFSLPLPMPDEVHLADRILLMTEKRDLLPKSFDFSPLHGGGIEPLDYHVHAWTPKHAEHTFLHRFATLTDWPLEELGLKPAKVLLCAPAGRDAGLVEVARMVADGKL